MLLVGAALEPGTGVEQLLVILGAPLLAAATLAALGGYRALARGLRGDGRRLRRRHGRRLAAHLAVLARPQPWPRGPLLRDRQRARGAARGPRHRRDRGGPDRLPTHARAPRAPPRPSSRWASSRLSSSPPVASGPTSAPRSSSRSAPRSRRRSLAASSTRTALLVVAAPILALGALALVDLVSGADAHLTRSVLDAGGLGDLADVAQRRLQLSAHSFSRPIVFVFLPLILAVAVLAFVCAGSGSQPGWRRIRRLVPGWRAPWSRPSPGPSPTTPVPCFSRSAASTSSSSSATPGLRRPRQIRSLPLALRANRPSLAIFLDVSGRRESARGGARRGVPRSWPRRPRARPLRSARSPQPGAASRRRPSRASARLPDPAGRTIGFGANGAVSNLSAFPAGGVDRAAPASSRQGATTSSTSTSRSCRWSAGTPRSGPRSRRSAPSTPTRPRRSPTTSPTPSAPAGSSTGSRPGSPSPRQPPGPAGAGTAAATRSSPTASTSPPLRRGRSRSPRSCGCCSSAGPRSARACRSCSAPSAPWSSTCPAA